MSIEAVTNGGVPVDILWPRCVSIADEVATTLVRTAFSVDVRENYDMAAAWFDARGIMVAQGNISAMGHTGCMPYVVKSLLEKSPANQLRPGDILVTNDPWIGCGHTPDVFVVTPVFLDGQLVAFVMTSAHQLDIGGRQSSTRSREIYEEGIRIPPMYLFRAGHPNEDLLAIIRENVRFPNVIVGDIMAQVAANHVGGERILAMMKDAGLANLEALTDEIVALTESTMRKAIREIPDGLYTNEMLIEEPDQGYNPLTLRVAVTIKGDSVEVDFDGTSAQVDRPVNVALNYTRTYAMVALKLACDPHLPNNEGAHLPIKVRAPEGSIVNAKPPAPVYWRLAIGITVFELVSGALFKALPDRISAGSGSVPVWQYTFAGYRNDGRPFLAHAHSFGGTGGRPTRDGLSAMGFPYAVRNVPIEIIENETPLLAGRRSLAPDSGGTGRHRGGLGETLVFRAAPNRVDPNHSIVLSIAAGRFRFPPQGVLGGRPGRLGALLVNGDPVGHAVWQDLYFTDTDVVTLETPGGGGYGEPAERDEELVRSDVEAGYVTLDKARTTFATFVGTSKIII